ncbi:hypothetical protein B0H14DRAFT_2646573 [Mycena olivaceomarginata]|nr:hypothetical protein B0H14DRAFT_2646573 [Mycena olivaceomarginata]
MGRQKKVPAHLAAAAARARNARHPVAPTLPPQNSPEPGGPGSPPAEPDTQARTILSFSESELPDLETVSDNEGENECSWDGGVNHSISDSGSDWNSTENSDHANSDSDSDLSELEGPDLVQSLQTQLEQEIHALGRATAYETINAPISTKNWRQAEANRALGYTGNSDRTKRRREKKARDGADLKAESIKSAPAARFKSFFTNPVASSSTSSTSAPAPAPAVTVQTETPIFTGYLSDLPSDETSSSSSEDEADEESDKPPPKKRVRRKLDVPARTARLLGREKQAKDLQTGLTDIEKLISSGVSGAHDPSHLQMVVRNKRKVIKASEIAAESQGFAAKWGGRLVRTWVRYWIKHRQLPVSARGKHGKVFSLLDDPNICAELRSFVRSNKWAMDPTKLAEFSKANLVSAAADKYLRHIIDTEMPVGLKKYMDVELFPRLHLKPGPRHFSRNRHTVASSRGISLHRAQEGPVLRWT